MRPTGGAGAEVGEELVDHRRLRDERDDAHRAVACRARERVTSSSSRPMTNAARFNRRIADVPVIDIHSL